MKKQIQRVEGTCARWLVCEQQNEWSDGSLTLSSVLHPWLSGCWDGVGWGIGSQGGWGGRSCLWQWQILVTFSCPRQPHLDGTYWETVPQRVTAHSSDKAFLPHGHFPTLGWGLCHPFWLFYFLLWKWWKMTLGDTLSSCRAWRWSPSIPPTHPILAPLPRRPQGPVPLKFQSQTSGRPWTYVPPWKEQWGLIKTPQKALGWAGLILCFWFFFAHPTPTLLFLLLRLWKGWKASMTLLAPLLTLLVSSHSLSSLHSSEPWSRRGCWFWHQKPPCPAQLWKLEASESLPGFLSLKGCPNLGLPG